MLSDMTQFVMPRYREIPNVGLYLEQTIKYVNECLSPLDISITPSMLSNYVKQGYIRRPVKKQYYADQIAYLIFTVLAKQVLSMDNVATLFSLQEQTYSLDVAYNYFCDELEHILRCQFGEETPAEAADEELPFAKKTLRSVIMAISQIIYLGWCFQQMKESLA